MIREIIFQKDWSFWKVQEGNPQLRWKMQTKFSITKNPFVRPKLSVEKSEKIKHARRDNISKRLKFLEGSRTKSLAGMEKAE